LEGAQRLYLKLFRSTIDSATKGGCITNVEGAAGVELIIVVISYAAVMLYPENPSFSANILSYKVPSGSI
jgi:hypothetical protein